MFTVPCYRPRQVGGNTPVIRITTHHRRRYGSREFFLDKSPRIVEYQLRRLSNAQLLLVDRSTDDAKYLPVFQAIIARPGISLEPRIEALQSSATIKGTSVIRELFAAIGQTDLADRNGELVFQQLTDVLLSQPKEALQADLQLFESGVTDDGQSPRIASYAALLHLGLADQAWEAARESHERTNAFLLAVRHLPTESARAATRSRIQDCLADSSPVETRRAAIRTLQTIPSASTETFRSTAGMIQVDELRSDVVRTLLRLPPDDWPRETVSEVLEFLVARVESLAPEDRTSAAELDGQQLADNLLPLIPRDQARRLRERLNRVTVRVVQIETVHEEMRFDKEYFAVEAGRPVQIVLRNDDAMPHNLVITAPESLREVALLAGQMSSQPGPSGKQYVPDSELVLHSTKMVQPGLRERLVFSAPQEPGEYPYVCTFPRHWMRMYGVMVVVQDLDAWLANPQPPQDPLGNTRPIVQHWKFEDFNDVQAGLRGRTRDIGKRLFQEATCAQCHKVHGEGGAVGPELTDVLQRWKGDQAAVLREILEPSFKIEPKYAMHTVVTADGQVFSGVVTTQDTKSLTIVTNPESPQPQVIPRADIEDMIQSNSSMMPKGLLDRFSRDEIYELLAFITGI